MHKSSRVSFVSDYRVDTDHTGFQHMLLHKTFHHQNRASLTIFHLWQQWQISLNYGFPSALNDSVAKTNLERTALSFHFISCTICGFTPYFLLNMAGLCWCIRHRPHTLSPTPCCYRQSPVQSWLAERVGGMRVKFWVLYQLLQPLLPRPLDQPATARVGQMSGTGYHWGNWSNVPCPEGR